MADLPKNPCTRKEIYLAAALGVYSGELPTPITRTDKYLYRLATEGVAGSIDEEDLEAAVAAYIESSGITTGTTSRITFSINADDLGLDVTIYEEDEQ